MDPGGMLLEDFGQRVDLTRRIREVLANYPEGTTALRELIQNADDAGASRVRLCLDRRAHGASSLLAPAPVQWQGPALLAHNDAAFTDEDFASISRIGDSKKAWKTGRFRALKIKLTERNKDLEVFPVTAERVPGKEMNLGRAKLRTVAAANTPAAVAPVHQLASTWVWARKSSAPAHLHLGGGEEEPSNQRGDPGRGRAQHQRGDPGRGRGGDPGRGHAGAGAGGGGGGGRLRRWRIQN